MRRNSLYAAAILLGAIASPCAAQQDSGKPSAAPAPAFEGVIRQENVMALPAAVSRLVGPDERDPLKILQAVLPKLDSLGEESIIRSEQTLSAKAGRIRLDMNASAPALPAPIFQTYSILDRDSIFVVVPVFSRVMVASQRELGERTKRQYAALAGSDTAAPTVTDLGTRSAHGVQVHGYRVLWATRVAEIWLDPSVRIPGPEAAGFQKAMGLGAEPEWAKALPRIAGFPVEQTAAMRSPAALGDGWLVSRFAAGQPVPQAVPDSLFVIPGLPRMPLPEAPAGP